MLFNSYQFLLGFLPAALLIYWFADRSPRWRSWILVVLSLAFYAYWDVRFLPLMVGSILINWWLAGHYAETKQRALVVIAILANLAVLGVFKYVDFVLGTVSFLAGTPFEPLRFALPLGISFFTFHHIMYLVDLERGRAPIYPLDRYALYICFFPQALSGPMARWNEVMHQFGERAFAPGWEHRCALGAAFIVLGLLQKTMLADPIARTIDPIYATALAGAVPDGQSWLALGFAFQVFFDFAGYSDVAIGLALIFGVHLPPNFNAPFRTTSIIEFWQCWHMTLARFLRDYVYTPLTRMRIGGRRQRMMRVLLAILVTMALCGLWHGAGWTFVLWGTLQGVAIVFALVWVRYLPPPPAVVGWAATVGFFVVTAVLFRAGSMTAAWHIYQGLLVIPASKIDGMYVLLVAIACAVLLPPSRDICRPITKVPRLLVAMSLAAAFTLVLVALGARENYQFVYFQF